MQHVRANVLEVLREINTIEDLNSLLRQLRIGEKKREKTKRNEKMSIITTKYVFFLVRKNCTIRYQ